MSQPGQLESGSSLQELGMFGNTGEAPIFAGSPLTKWSPRH